jgi:hypothetical protein
MARRTLLRAALHEKSRLRELVEVGMGAFNKSDVTLIAEDQRFRIGDSVDLDAASKGEYPEANRWDYIVSIPHLKELAGIEPHSAKDSEVSVVIRKKKHAMEYLRGHLQNGYGVTKWFWVTHGPVSFSKMDPARRRLDQNGIQFVGRLLRRFE